MPIEHVGALWPHVRGYLADALARDRAGRYLPADVLHEILHGRVKLWIEWNNETGQVDAAVITEIINYPQLRELRIWLVGGRNMTTWAKPALAMVEDFARAEGCRLVSGGLRKGWARIGGYRISGVTLEKRLA